MAVPHSTHHTAAKFDVILIDPPFNSSFTWDDLQDLPVPQLAADPSFVFLWVGSGAGEGLERGREVLAKWGFRRCEDIVWVKTNVNGNKGPGVSVLHGHVFGSGLTIELDGPADYLAFDENKTALSDGNSRHCSTIY